MSSIGPREDLFRSGNVSQEMSNFLMIFENFGKIYVFLRMIQDEPGTISRPKKQHFDTKINDFEIKKSWCEALSLTFITEPAFG